MTTVVVCIYDLWCRSVCMLEPGNQTVCHTPVAPLRLSCHHHRRQELAPFIQNTGDILHGALAITIYLLEDLKTKQNIHFVVSLNNVSSLSYSMSIIYIIYYKVFSLNLIINN